MVAEFAALPLWTDAYLGDTQHFGATEHGAYVLLLIASWRIEDGGLPDDDRMLARYTRCTAGQWKRVKPTVMAPWTLCEDGKWRQKRLELERLRVRELSQSQSHKAKAKWLKEHESKHAAASAGHMPERCRNDATVPIYESKKKTEEPWDGVKRLVPLPGAATKRKKPQSAADQDMVKHLMNHHAMTWKVANEYVAEGRDGDIQIQRDLERISRAHGLGWFAEEVA